MQINRYLRTVTILIIAMLGALVVPALASAGTFSFTFNSPSPNQWTTGELTTLNAWTNQAAGPITPIKAVTQLAGGPENNLTINVVKDPGLSTAGTYGSGTLTLRDLNNVDVFEHELTHATQEGNSIQGMWSEGLARAVEVEAMNLLEGTSFDASNYFDFHHSYFYDVYYDATNTGDVGVGGEGAPYSGSAALTVQRYQQTGYAFGKVILTYPDFVKDFNQLLFAETSPSSLTGAQLAAIAANVAPTVENKAFTTWYDGQGIFKSTGVPLGCRVFQRVGSLLVVDVFCRNSGSNSSVEAPVSGSSVTVTADGTTGQVFSGSGTTGANGFVTIGMSFGSYHGRIKIVASASTPQGTKTSTFWRGTDDCVGVCGIVTDQSSGTVRLHSPESLFTSTDVTVTNGAWDAGSGSLPWRKQIVAEYLVGGVGDTVHDRRLTKAGGAPFYMRMGPV